MDISTNKNTNKVNHFRQIVYVEYNMNRQEQPKRTTVKYQFNTGWQTGLILSLEIILILLQITQINKDMNL